MWTQIPGYEGLYEISDQLEIRSLDRESKSGQKLKGRVITQSLDSHGYLIVRLNGKKHYVHRLIATIFVPNPNNYSVVNHLNGIKLDNNPSNLEWCTKADNNRHAFSTGLQKSGDNHHNYLGDIEVIDRYGLVVDVLKGSADMVKKGYDPSNVSRCLQGIQKTHKGFTFKRINKE